MKTLTGHSAAVSSVAFMGDEVASGSYDNSIKIWNLNTGNCLRTLIGHTSDIESIAFR